MGVEIEAQRAGRRGGDVWQIRLAATNDDALKLVRKRGGVIGQAGEFEAGDLRRERHDPSDGVIRDVDRGGVDVEHGDQSFAPEVIGLLATGFGEGEEARDVELGVVRGHGEAARLEVAAAIRIVGQAVPQIDMADDGARRGVDHGDGVLRTVGHEHAQAIGRDGDVVRLRAGGDVAGLSPGRIHGGGERAPQGIVDADDGDGIAGGIGDEGVGVVRRQRDGLGFIADGDLHEAHIGIRAEDAHAVVGGIDRPEQAVVERERDGAGVRGAAPWSGLSNEGVEGNDRPSTKAEDAPMERVRGCKMFHGYVFVFCS